MEDSTVLDGWWARIEKHCSEKEIVRGTLKTAVSSGNVPTNQKESNSASLLWYVVGKFLHVMFNTVIDALSRTSNQLVAFEGIIEPKDVLQQKDWGSSDHAQDHDLN